jgi:hypothetical protein
MKQTALRNWRNEPYEPGTMAGSEWTTWRGLVRDSTE